MFTQDFTLHQGSTCTPRSISASALLAGTIGLASCARVQTGSSIARTAGDGRGGRRPYVTEWDEFTGRLEAVQSVGVRPRVSGLIAEVSV